MWSVFKFWRFPGGPYEPSLRWKSSETVFCVPRGLLSSIRGPFNVPSDGLYKFEEQVVLDDEIYMCILIWDLKTFEIDIYIFQCNIIFYYIFAIKYRIFPSPIWIHVRAYMNPMKKSELSDRKNNGLKNIYHAILKALS